MKDLWGLVGGNGAGKSTFFKEALEPLGMPFINADLIAQDIYPDDPEGHSYDAAKIAESMRIEAIQSGESFCFETVFSHPSKIDFLGQAKALGYRIILVLIHVDDVSLNLARISQRVIDGGHDVPSEKVVARIPRTLENVKLAIPLCDRVHVLDNSRLDDPFRPIITLEDGRWDEQVDPLPDWAANLAAPDGEE